MEARIDKWLWAARIYKTRTLAADACKNGRITINGAQVKPSRTVKEGDKVAVAGFGTVIINELANGCLPGYLYTPESLVTGGYETDTSMLGENFGRHLVDKVLETIENVK